MEQIAGFNINQKYWFPVPMNQLKQRQGKNRVCGPYYTTRKLITGKHPGHSFYLDSDFQPFTRWKWCDDINNSIGHTGWYTDEYGDSDKIRGIVVLLPHARFLAGWSMGKGMASEIDGDVYDDETEAANAADSMAEYAAERQREYEVEQRAIEAEEEANQGDDAEETECY
jgi:hypothetical protein